MENRKNLSIALIGFMATGKSTIGPLLAKKIGYTFIDTDEMVEKAMGMTIFEIFKNLGEDAFREAEHAALKEAVERKQSVISTGGGIILFERNRRLLREKTFVVSLTSQPETIFKRIQGDHSRPLLAGKDPLGQIIKIMGERQEFYEACDFKLSTEKRTAEACCEKILAAYKKA